MGNLQMGDPRVVMYLQSLALGAYYYETEEQSHERFGYPQHKNLDGPTLHAILTGILRSTEGSLHREGNVHEDIYRS